MHLASCCPFPPGMSADDFVEAVSDKDIVAAVAGNQDAQADRSSGDDDRPNKLVATTHSCSTAEVVAALDFICYCLEGTWKGSGCCT